MSTNSGNKPLQLVPETQLQALNAIAAAMNKDQLIWASGYLAGLSNSAMQASPAPVSSASKQKLTVLYGSQTGNAKGVAEQVAQQVGEAGIEHQVVSMADYKTRQLKNETHLLVVVSTHGEGDPPDDAIELHEFIQSKKAPKLDNLEYAVIGLGDTSYEFFCQTAKDFDNKLAELNAKPFHARLDCDVDYDSVVPEWTEKAVASLLTRIASDSQVNNEQVTQLASAASVVYDKKSPFHATLNETIKITGRDSIKDIRHIEISLADSGIQYLPGDALGVYFTNSPELVQRVMDATQTKAQDDVSVAGVTMPLVQALTEELELTLSYLGFVKAYAAVANNAELNALMADKTQLRALLDESQIVDIVERFPAKVDPQVLVDALRPISARLYSIASSQAEVEDEVHLTVAHVSYDKNGWTHQGGASGYLSTRCEVGETVKVYVQNNDNFRLPNDPSTPVIMIGPGTGIAPFRAFMQERDVQEAEGDNWLIFGNPNFTQDFLYQTEWQAYLKSGLLSKISLAFSRDQAHKIYVQDKLREEAAEVFAWLEKGAHVYVCGDATRMAKDVEQALLDIIESQGNYDSAQAKAYLTDLRKAKRYQKDVY